MSLKGVIPDEHHVKMGLDSSFKGIKIVIYIMTWIDLENTVLNEISQLQKDICMASLTT